MRCPECHAAFWRRVYAEGYDTCGTCGGSVRKVSSDPSDLGSNIHVFKEICDENIDGVPRIFTSERKHRDALRRAGMVNKHYLNKCKV